MNNSMMCDTELLCFKLLLDVEKELCFYFYLLALRNVAWKHGVSFCVFFFVVVGVDFAGM